MIWFDRWSSPGPSVRNERRRVGAAALVPRRSADSEAGRRIAEMRTHMIGNSVWDGRPAAATGSLERVAEECGRRCGETC